MREIGAAPGEPLPGLTSAERERFRAGQQRFTHQFTPTEGLGPLFNETRCNNCHDLPTSGGTGAELVTKATRFVTGTCDALAASGGDNIQRHATPLLMAAGISREQVPEAATAVVSIVPPALYGLGLLDAVPDSEILRLEAAAARNGGTIRGRAGRTPDGRVGRFGRKAEFATLAQFVEGALLEEIGITSPAHPAENRPNGRPLPTGTDPVPDPELSQADVDAIVDFVRLLAPPAPEEAQGSARDSIRSGEKVFADVGCTSCHLPRLSTGEANVPALSRRTVAAYTDLLLHDLGPGLASICAANAGPSQWRTAPLMGVRHRKMLLHDGRALSVDAAIRMHGGEAAAARDAYERLPRERRMPLLRFVNSR
jgi:CxxC motif-containing protein (DUF1111 family)